jgi:hypothetical protein
MFKKARKLTGMLRYMCLVSEFNRPINHAFNFRCCENLGFHPWAPKAWEITRTEMFQEIKKTLNHVSIDEFDDRIQWVE